MSQVLFALRRLATERPADLALEGAGIELSFAELEARVAALAAKLAGARMRRLAIAADNGPDWIIADLAALRAGITCIPVPLFFSSGQVAHLLADGGVDAVLTDRPDAFLSASLGFESWSPNADDGLALLRRSIRRDTGLARRSGVGKLTYTSGSTGRPRGVCLSQTGMEAVAASLAEALEGLGVRRHLTVLPLATLLENIAGVYVPILLGATIVAPPLARVGLSGSSAFDAAQLRAAIDEARAESVILLPQMLHALNMSAAADSWSDCPLRFAAVGGGAVAPAELALARTLGIPACEGYGLSECHSVVALNTPEACREGSVGRPLPHAKVRIAEDGEIMVGGAVMLGYLHEEATTAPEIATGDLGHLDEDGYLYVSGRKKNLFITSFGRNVAPEWVERELVHERVVAQALVWGEALPVNAAVLVPAANGLDRAALQRAVDEANRRLPDYARVAVWTIADEPFSPQNGELTANGRLRRDHILERYRMRLGELVNDAIAQTPKVMNA